MSNNEYLSRRFYVVIIRHPQIGGNRYGNLQDCGKRCLTTVQRAAFEETFIREVSISKQINHTNIHKLVGLVTDADESEVIEGTLLELFENARVLRDIEFIHRSDYDKWRRQVSDAIKISPQEWIWGDAKAGNVLVNMFGNAILFDFGLGYTKGWVNRELHNTTARDLQGLEDNCVHENKS